jgi:hypothetical protein
VVLSIFIHGYDLGSTGMMVGIDRPAWYGFGNAHQHFPVSGKTSSTQKSVTESEFASLVDLAHRMPSFGTESSHREVALSRTLRGCGLPLQESPFLDFAIALEAALLGGTDSTSELAFRFSLYGALFLHDEFSPRESSNQLRNIYRVRSKLVHGGRINPADRARADADAPKLLKALIRKALESGWPDTAELDALALRLD